MNHLIARISLCFFYFFSTIVIANPKILEGDVVSHKDFPFIVHLFALENNSREKVSISCTGSLIAPQWILTAAHCVTQMKDQGHDYSIRVFSKLPLPIELSSSLAGSYVFEEETEKLFYIKTDEELEIVQLNDIEKFKKQLKSIAGDYKFKRLSNEEFNALIFSNGGHDPAIYSNHLSPKRLKVAVGELAGFDFPIHPNQTLLSVDKVFTYDKIGFNPDYDVALVKLSEPIRDIFPVIIPKTPGEIPSVKSSVPVVPVGYGANNIAFKELSSSESGCKENERFYRVDYIGDEFLHKGTGITLNDFDAEFRFKQSIEKGFLFNFDDSVKYNSETMLAMYSPEGKHMLPGDSGGPLLVKTQEGYVEIGIASWGLSLPRKTLNEEDKKAVFRDIKLLPVFYANLLNKDILNFIHETMKNH